MDLREIFTEDMEAYRTVQTFKAGQCMIQEGQKLDALYFITKGRVKCFITHENGKSGLIDIQTAPCLMGDLELIGVQQKCNGVIAITDCTCQIIELKECKEAILNDPKFLRYLCNTLGNKAIRNAAYISMSQNYPLRNRLITFLLQVQMDGIYTGPLTEASSYLGVSYRHLLYVLAQLVEEGILEKKNGIYRICDMQRLAEEQIAFEHFT